MQVLFINMTKLVRPKTKKLLDSGRTVITQPVHVSKYEAPVNAKRRVRPLKQHIAIGPKAPSRLTKTKH